MKDCESFKRRLLRKSQSRAFSLLRKKKKKKTEKESVTFSVKFTETSFNSKTQNNAMSNSKYVKTHVKKSIRRIPLHYHSIVVPIFKESSNAAYLSGKEYSAFMCGC